MTNKELVLNKMLDKLQYDEKFEKLFLKYELFDKNSFDLKTF